MDTARELGVPFVERKKKSISSLLLGCDIVIVRSADSVQLYHASSKDPYFFHPNLARVRVKALMNGGRDAFIEACGLQKGDTFLDCTLGFASDSIVASYAVGEDGSVTGLEASPVLAYVTSLGLRNWNDEESAIRNAMGRITVKHADHLEYLRSLEDKCVDIVYFDPMFEESIDESNAMQSMSPFADHGLLLIESVEEAKRVSRRKVVLKDHFRSTRFKEFGFRQQVRKTSKFHYGIIDLEG